MRVYYTAIDEDGRWLRCHLELDNMLVDLFSSSLIVDNSFWGPYMYLHWSNRRFIFLEVTEDNVLSLLTCRSAELRLLAAMWLENL